MATETDRDETLSSYYELDRVRVETASGRHREVIGGLWDELGELQFEWLLRAGLEPSMPFLDVGCGCLRLGVRLVAFLEPGLYYGIDVNAPLIEAGWERELGDLQSRLPRENLRVTGEFEVAPFDRSFRMGMAQSVFTHLPLNHVRLCLERLAPAFVDGGELFATFFECPADRPTADALTHQPGGVTTSPSADPYHYRFGDFVFAASGLPWTVEYIGDWNHPRGQRLLVFRRR